MKEISEMKPSLFAASTGQETRTAVNEGDMKYSTENTYTLLYMSCISFEQHKKNRNLSLLVKRWVRRANPTSWLTGHRYRPSEGNVHAVLAQADGRQAGRQGSFYRVPRAALLAEGQ